MRMERGQHQRSRNHHTCAAAGGALLAPSIAEARRRERGEQLAEPEPEGDDRDAGVAHAEVVLQPASERDEDRLTRRHQTEHADGDDPSLATDRTDRGLPLCVRLAGRVVGQGARHERRQQQHRRGTHHVADPPARGGGDETHRGDAHQQAERPRRLRDADHPAPAVERHSIRHPRAKREIEHHLALGDDDDRQSEERNVVARRGEQRTDPDAAEADDHGRAAMQAVREPAGERRGQPRQFADRQRHTHAVERNTLAGGDGGQERRREPKARVRAHPRGGQQRDTSPHVLVVGLVEDPLQHPSTLSPCLDAPRPDSLSRPWP